MLISYGVDPKQDLELIAAAIFAESSLDPKHFEKEIVGLSGFVKNKILSGNSLENILDQGEFNSEKGKKFKQAISRKFNSKEDENSFKRIIQVSSSIIGGKTKDVTGGVNSFEITNSKPAKGEYGSGYRIFKKSSNPPSEALNPKEA